MSSQLSDTSTAVEWPPLRDTQLSSQVSEFSTEFHPAPLKADDLNDALSIGWAGYLSTQHTGRELDLMKRALDEQGKQINRSLAGLQHDLSSHQQLVMVTAAESKARLEQLSSEMNRFGPLQDALPLLQHEVRSSIDKVSTTVSSMNNRFELLQERMEGINTLVSKDINSVRHQYGAALEAIESLQGELRELRANKASSEQKLAALENQMGILAEARQELPQGTANILGQLLARQEDESVQWPGHSDAESHPYPCSDCADNHCGGNEGEEILPRIVVATSEMSPQTASEYASQVSIVGKAPRREKIRRAVSEISHAAKKKQAPLPPGNDLRALLLHYRDEYKNSPPRSEAAFIWTFIETIADSDLSRHVQISLATISPGFVSPKPGLRHRTGRRCVNIREGLTWREFQKALLKMPPMGAT